MASNRKNKVCIPCKAWEQAEQIKLPAHIMLYILLALIVTPCELQAESNTSISLNKKESYFTLDGKQKFLLGRNPFSRSEERFKRIFGWAAESGEKIVRIHLTNCRRQSAKAGQIDESWVSFWENIFDLAAKNDLHVLPVFGVWANWNDGSKHKRWYAWHRNSYNAINGGPAKQPAELFQDTDCRRLYLQWLKMLVTRWHNRSNILGWEVFSELDLVPGATRDEAVDFAEHAAKVVRAADPKHRPVTASLAGTNEWPELYNSNALDFIQTHPYAARSRYKGRLDEQIISSVRQMLSRYGKPVFLGESGLDSRGARRPLNIAERAHVGIRHAIWASVVSGAMNGRMLWWEDGYGGGDDLITKYRHASVPVTHLLNEIDIDFSGFKPISLTKTDGLKGAAIGHDRLILSWFRDSRCEPPHWPIQTVADQVVTLKASGRESRWTAIMHNGITGKIIDKISVNRYDNGLRIHLPPFEDSVVILLEVSRLKK